MLKAVSVLVISLAMIGCAGLGDGKVGDYTPRTAFGKAVTAKVAKGVALYNSNPQVKKAANFIRKAVCIRQPGLPLVCDQTKVIEAIQDAKARIANVKGQPDPNDQAISEALGGLSLNTLEGVMTAAGK